MLKKIIKKIVRNNYYLNKYSMLIYKKLNPGIYEKYYGFYPLEMNMELTSFCNSHCSFCTRDEMIEKGYKEVRNIEKELAFKVIDKYRELYTISGAPENLARFIFVGLGEPLTHPDCFEILAYARKKFPKGSIALNTNGIILNEKIRKSIINSSLDFLTISLCHFDKSNHQKYLRIDKYDKIIDNIHNFLNEKGNQKPKTEVHVFDTPENKKVYSQFAKHFNPYLNSDDILSLYGLNELIHHDTSRNRNLPPCFSIWNIIGSDYNGDLYPCCIGAMTKHDPVLTIGNVNDDASKIIDKLKAFREKQIHGEFGNCYNCGLLYDVKKNQRIYQSYLDSIKNN